MTSVGTGTHCAGAEAVQECKGPGVQPAGGDERHGARQHARASTLARFHTCQPASTADHRRMFVRDKGLTLYMCSTGRAVQAAGQDICACPEQADNMRVRGRSGA
eukprot:165153-Chlamydomonas_euryale.AAC.6